MPRVKSLELVPAKVSAGAGAMCSLAGDVSSNVASSVGATYSITGAGDVWVTADVGTTC